MEKKDSRKNSGISLGRNRNTITAIAQAMPKAAETAGTEETGRILNVRLAEYAVSLGFS